jgi:hypothetical protein
MITKRRSLLPVGGAPVSVSFTRRYDRVGNFAYAGIAPSGSLETDSVWSITRIELDENELLVGTLNATSVAWSDRLTETYA